MKCAICEADMMPFGGSDSDGARSPFFYGNNPEPLGEVEQRVCGDCNGMYVIPARLGLLAREDWPVLN